MKCSNLNNHLIHLQACQHFLLLAVPKSLFLLLQYAVNDTKYQLNYAKLKISEILYEFTLA